MKEKFGQWWLDVAKYVFTGVILSSVFGNVEDLVYLYTGGIALVIFFVLLGLYLINSQDKDNEINKKNKKGSKK